MAKAACRAAGVPAVTQHRSTARRSRYLCPCQESAQGEFLEPLAPLAKHAAGRSSHQPSLRAPQMMKKAKAKKAEAEAKAKQALAERKAAKELAWREGVMQRPAADPAADPDQKWLGLDNWKESLAKSEDSKPKSEMQQNMENKARASVLKKVHDGVTNKIMVILTEICSKVMESAEGGIRSADDQIGAVVNAMNGVICTYHMGEKDRWQYLRRYASDRLTDMICNSLNDVSDVAEKITEIKGTVSGALESKKGEASEMMNAKLGEMLASSEPEIPEGVPGDTEEMKANLDAMIKGIGEQVTKMAVSKMDTTTAKRARRSP